MAFVPRSAEEILNDAVNYISINTKLTDFNVGSVIRTLLEAMAFEDATQYAQMLNILNSFFLSNLGGKELEDRAAVYDLSRRQPTPSSGEVYFLDTQLEKAFLVQDLTGGVSTTIVVDDVGPFPAAPFTARLGEGSPTQEDVSISAVDATNNTLTVVGTVAHNHSAAGESIDTIDNRANMVTLVTGLPDRTISSGIALRSKASNVNIVIEAYTSTAGVHPNGNYASNTISVTTKNVGTASVIPPKRLSKMVASPPFFGAAVVNVDTITGGANLESDADLRDRIRLLIASLAAGTVAAIRNACLNASDSAIAERITRVNLFEDQENRVVNAYVNTGSETFTGDKNFAVTDTTSAVIPAAGTDVISLNNAADFPEATSGDPQFLIIDPTNSNASRRIIQYNILDTATNSVSTTFTVIPPADIPINTQVAIPEVITQLTEFNVKYYNLPSFPVTQDSFLLYEVTYNNPPLFTVSNISHIALLTQGTDYLLNEAIGQIEFLNIPLENKCLLAVYNTFTGIIKAAQNNVDGSLTNPSAFPGVRSAGVKVRVLPSLSHIIDFFIDVGFDPELTDLDAVQFLAEQAISSYLSSLNIGQDVILAEIIDRMMDIVGVNNVHIVNPSDDVVISHDHFAAGGIITIS